MPHNGRRYRLTLYTHIFNRWGKFSVGIGVILLALAAGLWILPTRLPQYHFQQISDTSLKALAGIGGYAVLLAVLLFWIGKSAYIQPFPTHLRLVTPILRMNISYRRVMKATSVQMQHLFPIFRYKGWRSTLLRPLATQTAIVLEMRGWPLPRRVMGLFLSPFFFPDKTSRFALLVPKWMDFSMEMESFRSAWFDSQHEADTTPHPNLLASLADSKR